MYVDFLSVYHIPGVECGNNHYLDAEFINDVTCQSCISIMEQSPELVTIVRRPRLTRAEQMFKEWGEAAIKSTPKKSKVTKPCKCGGTLVERTNKRPGHKYYGKKFLGCSNYPDCLETEKMPKDGTIV